MIGLSRLLTGASRYFDDVGRGVRATSNVMGKTTDDFVNAFKTGVDEAGLRTSLEEANRGIDDAGLRSMLAGSGTVDDATFQNVKAGREYYLNRREKGLYDTADSFNAVKKNLEETGEAFGGYSAAGQTRSESFLTSIFGTEDKGMAGELGMLGTAALLGGGMNYASGGEFGTGAGIGALAATGIRGAGRMVKNNMENIETSMMKRLLGETEYGRLAPKDPVKAQAEIPGTPDVLLSSQSGKTVQELIDEGHGNLTLAELGFNTGGKNFGGKPIDENLSLEDFLNSRNASYMKRVKKGKMVPTGEMTQGEFGALRVDDAGNFTNQSFVLTQGTPGTPAVPAQPGQSVRTQALNAIKGMSPDQVKNAGVGSSYMQKLLTDPKRGNVGTNMRVMTLSGAALAGVPFTGRRNDHSSGFNKNRGNKI